MAARQYASTHYYWHDFTPPPPDQYSSFANYTDYVAHVFKTRPFNSGGTDTAGAIQRVRTEDLVKTRGGSTYIMVFTDGASNDYSGTVSNILSDFKIGKL